MANDTNNRRGQDSEQWRSLDELAQRFGLTKQGIRYVEQRALEKMRRHPIMRQLAMDAGLITEVDHA